MFLVGAPSEERDGSAFRWRGGRAPGNGRFMQETGVLFALVENHVVRKVSLLCRRK